MSFTLLTCCPDGRLGDREGRSKHSEDPVRVPGAGERPHLGGMPDTSPGADTGQSGTGAGHVGDGGRAGGGGERPPHCHPVHVRGHQRGRRRRGEGAETAHPPVNCRRSHREERTEDQGDQGEQWCWGEGVLQLCAAVLGPLCPGYWSARQGHPRPHTDL